MDALGERDLEAHYPDVPVLAPPSADRAYVNPRTGVVAMVPVGIDPAFAYPPGRAHEAARQALDEKLAAANPEIARAVGRLRR